MESDNNKTADKQRFVVAVVTRTWPVNKERPRVNAEFEKTLAAAGGYRLHSWHLTTTVIPPLAAGANPVACVVDTIVAVFELI